MAPGGFLVEAEILNLTEHKPEKIELELGESHISRLGSIVLYGPLGLDRKQILITRECQEVHQSFV